MSLVVPVEYLPVKQNGKFCADSGRDFELVSMAGAIQMMGVPPMPGTRIPSSFSGLPSSLHLPMTQSIGQSADEFGLSKTVVQHNVRTIQPHSTSASKYIGLPYQDHNYVQLPPSTPPLSPSLTLGIGSIVTVPKSNLLIDNISYHTAVTTTPDDSVTRCICEFQHDDGYMIQCDDCGVWQHVDCMEVDRNNIPESYMCELCEPRKVDKHKAIQIQTNKRDALSLLRLDSSATETEDETTDGRRRSFDKSPAKKEMKEIICGGTSINVLALTKKRKSKSKRDERLKRKLQVKRQNNGQQRLSLSSPKKAHFEPVLIDNFAETVRQDAALPQNGAIVMPVSSLNMNPATVEVYQEAVSNQYTLELQNLLASIKFNGQQGSMCSPSVYERLQFGPPSCLPAAVSNTKMGLEACEDILTNQPLIEYVGKVMLRDQYDRDSLFYYRPEPNVLFYSKLGGLDLCIDASLYGNIARYVRRSCTPNAEVRHLLEGNTVRFFICATKSIVRGAEIMIPFDFNYHKCCYAVDCACTRISCPVAKFQRREASNSSGPTAKRQRSARSLEVTSTSQEHGLLSPRKFPTSSLFPFPMVSPVPGVSKNSRPTALSSFKPEPVTEVEIAKTEIKVEPDPVKLEPLSPTWPLTGVTAPVVTQESSFPVSSASTVGASSSLSAASVSDADENEKSKKKQTREEKKLEAVMKMFERLEKQQERKKEAQSRHEQGRGKEVTRTRESRKSKDKSENKNTNEMTFDTKQPISNVASNFPEQVSNTLPKSAARMETKQKMKRSKHTTTTTRRASMSAATHSATSFSHPPVTLIGSCDGLQSAGLEHAATNVTEEPTVSSLYLSNESALETATSLLALSAERWTGCPKKLMMKGQDLHKQLTIKTDGLETNSNSEGDSGKEYVQCVPSPHSCTLNALRRNSMPAFGSAGSTAGTNGKAALLATVPAVNGADSKGCSAKKRWLQQAMCDKTELQPIGEEAVSSSSQIMVNSNSPSDFVTPLKKRRLARESLSTESPPLTVQQEDSTSTSSMFPLYESISDDDHIDADTAPSSAREVVNDLKPEKVNMWNDKLASESGLLRTQALTPLNAKQAAVHPEAFLLMPVGYHCQVRDGRSAGSAISGSTGLTSTPNGFGTGVGVELNNVQAWQKTIPELLASGINNPYPGSGYLSNLIPGQKRDSLGATSLLDYQLAFGSMESAYGGSRSSSGNQAAPLTVGLSSNAGTTNAVYLTKQVTGQALNPEVSCGYPMSLFHAVNTQNCDVQGIMALAEAACRSRERTADNKSAHAGESVPPPACAQSNGAKNIADLPFAFPLTGSDQHAKHQTFFGATPMPNYICGLQQGSDASNLLSLHGNAVLASSASELPIDNSPANHFTSHENGVSHWRGTPFCDGFNGLASRCDGSGFTTDVAGVNSSASVSSTSLSSPTSAGQCISKKKVSLHEYKMRRKSGGSGQGRLSSGSGSAPDSDTSLSASFDASVSPINHLISHPVLSDGSRDLSEGLSLAWSSDATEAEKALENLTSGEKLFKIDKAPGKLLNRTFHPLDSVVVSSVTSTPEVRGGPLRRDMVENVASPPMFQFDQKHTGMHNTSASDHSVVVEVFTTSVTSSASAENATAAANTPTAETSSFTSEPGDLSLVRC